MVFNAIYSKKYGWASERYKRKILAELEKKIEDFKEVYNTAKHLSKDVVEMSDMQDGEDLIVPPRFDCENCDGVMEPIT